MVESSKPESKLDVDDFNEMMTMTTSQQQSRNTNTFHKLKEKFNTTDILDDRLFEGDKEFHFPT